MELAPVSSRVSTSVRSLSRTKFSKIFVAAEAAFIIRKYHWMTAPLGDKCPEGIISLDRPTGHQQTRYLDGGRVDEALRVGPFVAGDELRKGFSVSEFGRGCA